MGQESGDDRPMGPHSPTPRPVHRRPLLLALTSVAAVTGVGVAARSGILSGGGEDGGGPGGVLELSAGAMGVEALRVALDHGVLTEVRPGRWRTGPLTTTTHSM